MINILKKYVGVKLISVFVFLLCGLALVELTVVSIFASTNNIEIPVTSMHVFKPIVLSLLGIASAVALLNRKKIGKYGLSIWFMIYIVTGAFWTTYVYQQDSSISWNNIIFLFVYLYCLWYLHGKEVNDWLSTTEVQIDNDGYNASPEKR